MDPVPGEDQVSYDLRLAFMEKYRELFPEPTLELLSHMYVKRAKYGVTYDPETEKLFAQL